MTIRNENHAKYEANAGNEFTSGFGIGSMSGSIVFSSGNIMLSVLLIM
jgi:hypothetical protein